MPNKTQTFDEREQSLILEAREVLTHYLSKNPVLSSHTALFDYCSLTLTSPKEQFHVLYLDRQNRLIKDVHHQTGTVDHVPVYPREVIKQALLLDACALILVHNHPGGNTTPSASDISMTKQINKACKAVGLLLHDHIIVGNGTPEYSMRSNGDF